MDVSRGATAQRDVPSRFSDAVAPVFRGDVSMKNTNKKPIPVQAARPRAVCPVCKSPSYSAGGTHPQCMLRYHDQLAKQQAAAALAAHAH